MDLKKYDGKLVRLKDSNDDIFEGRVVYNSDEYNESEFGRNEECLQMVNLLFYRNDIKEVEEIKNFSSDHSKFEELNIEDAISIEEVLTCEDDEHITRMLNFLENYVKEHEIDFYDGLIELLTSIEDEKYKPTINRILNILG